MTSSLNLTTVNPEHMERSASDGTMDLAELQVIRPNIRVIDHGKEQQRQQMSKITTSSVAQERLSCPIDLKSEYHGHLQDCRRLLKLSLKTINLSNSQSVSDQAQSLSKLLGKAKILLPKLEDYENSLITSCNIVKTLIDDVER